jgi:Hint domain
VSSDFPETARFSRRHLLKAIGVVAGALAPALPRKARAQWGGYGRCFLRGTHIRGAAGYRPVETFAVGDVLPARFSGSATVRKIFSFTIERDEAGWPQDCKLVRIGKGALAEHMPARDLFVTDAHAIFLDGVLVPAGCLVNGKTITLGDEGERDVLEYFHLEFDAHDVVDAEGALCESLLGGGMEPCAPIVSFSGGRSELTSHLRSAAAPFVDRRRPLDRIRDRLENRAGL